MPAMPSYSRITPAQDFCKRKPRQYARGKVHPLKEVAGRQVSDFAGKSVLIETFVADAGLVVRRTFRFSGK
jgi:hypothetical protein